MTDKRILKAVALAAVLIVSGIVMPGAGPPSPESSQVTPTATATPQTGEVSTESEDGYRSVPDNRVTSTSTEDIPEPESVSASAGAQTMQVETTTVDGEPALVLRDDETHEGRWVTVSTDWLREAVGEVPESVTIQHESGDTYAADLEVRGGSAAFYVREFSSNTVTFSGEVQINANPAQDGSQFTYDVNDLDSASDPTINLTGETNSEWDNESGDGVGVPSESSISVGGNEEPTGPGDGNPVLSVTPRGGSATHYESDDDFDVFLEYSTSGEKKNAEIQFDDPPRKRWMR